LLRQELAAGLDLDGQDAAYKFGIEIAARRRLDRRLEPGERRVGKALELAVIHGRVAVPGGGAIPKPAPRAWQGCGKLR